MDERRPFTRADALAAGVSAKLLRGSRFRRLFRQIYISNDVIPLARHRIEAGLMAHPKGARVSHQSAAVLYGLPVPDQPDVHVSVTRTKDRRGQPGLKSHLSPATAGVREVDGLPASEPIRMFVELASCLGLVDMVVLGDAMSRVLGITAAELRAGLAKSRDYWSRTARAAAAYVRDEVESPMESRLRMLLVLAGLPEPNINHKLRDDQGHVVARLDLAYPFAKVAVEYQGQHHRDDGRQWEDDIERDEYLDREAWQVVKVTSRGIYVEPWRTLERVVSTLRARGILVVAHTQAWQPFFPGRTTGRPA